MARDRAPLLLLAVTLVVIVGAGVALGTGLVQLSQTIETSTSPSAEPTSPAAGTSATPEPDPSAAPSAAPSTPGNEVAGRILHAAADGLRLRTEASASGEIVATLRAGQRMGIVSGPVAADGMDWYEVRIGPDDLKGWIAAGPDKDWLRIVEDGGIAFHCEGCGAAPALVSITPFGDAAITSVAGDEARDWRWSADGARLALTVAGGATSSVVVMNADGSDRREVGPGGYAPSWSPDGSRLAWSHETDLVVTDEELVPSALGLDLRSAGTPLWSPDGARLAFGAVDCAACPDDEPIVGDPPTAIFTVNVDGSSLRQIAGGNYDNIGSWSPDGGRLSMLRHDLSGEFPTRAFTMSADGGEPAFLLDGSAIHSAPAWSPDGNFMAIATPDGLVLTSGDGTDLGVLVPSSDAVIIGEVHWSPSGTWILYGTADATDGSASGLWIVPRDGSAPPAAITAEGMGAGQAEWQPVLTALP